MSTVKDFEFVLLKSYILITKRWFVVRVRRIYLDGLVCVQCTVETYFEILSGDFVVGMLDQARSNSLSLSPGCRNRAYRHEKTRWDGCRKTRESKFSAPSFLCLDSEYTAATNTARWPPDSTNTGFESFSQTNASSMAYTGYWIKGKGLYCKRRNVLHGM